MRSLRGRVSGLCQPDYVLDIPGGHGKAPIGPNYLSHAIRTNVNYPRNRGIVSWTIAVTFISIRQSRDLTMTEEGEGKPEPPEDGGIAASRTL